MQTKGKDFLSLGLLRQYWKSDLQAGFSVSLIALPLCLGIAIASGFPPVAGLFAAIVGGLLVSRVNGSHVTIAGPAAGLIVVNLAAVESLGNGDKAVGYPYALAAILVAGVMIMAFGFLKAGKLGDFFPSSVVHGMLAAIGVIIFVKQLFVGLGVKAEGHEFYEILMDIPRELRHANPLVVVVTVVSLAILVIYPKIRSKYIKMVPAPIWVLAVAIPLEFWFDFEHPHDIIFASEAYHFDPSKLLVHLPENLADAVVLPDFGKIATGTFWISAVTIALVTAIESVLSAIAVDSLDPMKRKTNLDRDLKGLGMGSIASAGIGGLPMISEIVRSSANVNAGAKSQWSNFIHGGFLALFLLVGAPIIDHIPMAALAAMLMFTGFRLASPREFKHAYEIGKSELLVFVSTMIVVLMTDLLIGIAFGVVLNMVINMVKGVSFANLFSAKVEEHKKGNDLTMEVKGTLTFSNYLGLKKRLAKNASVAKITLDFSHAKFVDHSALHHLHCLQRDREQHGKKLVFANDSHLHAVSAHPLSERRSNVKELSTQLSPRDLELQAFAQQNAWDFNPGSDLPDRWRAFPSFGNARLLREKNILNFSIEGCPAIVADVVMEKIGTVDRHEVTALWVDFGKRSLPSFTMEKEQIFDRMMEKLGKNDIDFDAYPAFSQEYYLNGENETAIRTFFSGSLIEFLETKKDFHVESNGRGLVVYHHLGHESIQSIMEMVQIATAFLGQGHFASAI